MVVSTGRLGMTVECYNITKVEPMIKNIINVDESVPYYKSGFDLYRASLIISDTGGNVCVHNKANVYHVKRQCHGPATN